MRKSARVSLVLMGVAALAACNREPQTKRDVYTSREDCLADWGNKPEDCKPATEPRHASNGFWYGPIYPIPFGYGNAWRGGTGGPSHAIGSSAVRSGSSSVSRGGFGSSARSSGG
jgi:uncharacterized protein YgiB involved in biofilm formation